MEFLIYPDVRQTGIKVSNSKYQKENQMFYLLCLLIDGHFHAVQLCGLLRCYVVQQLELLS